MRPVKPRPLHIADPIPVFWNIGEPDGDDAQFLAALLDVEVEDAATVIQVGGRQRSTGHAGSRSRPDPPTAGRRAR
jgi:hypothetical protein